MKDYYRILEIDSAATSEQIKTQHKLLLHAWHPDKFPDGDLKKKAHEKILEINEAYDILGNPTKRYTYNQKYRESFQSGYSSNNSSRSKEEKANNNYRKEPSPKASSSPQKEYSSNQQRNTTPQEGKHNGKLKGLVFSLFVMIVVFLLCDVLPTGMQNQVAQQEVYSSPESTAISTRVPPSFTPDPLAELKRRCVYWDDVSSVLLGETICVFGEVVTFIPREEVRVPEIGSEWIWYYYFSYEDEEFSLYHPSVDREFPDAYVGCIEVTGELKSSKTQKLYIEILSGNWKNWKLLKNC